MFSKCVKQNNNVYIASTECVIPKKYNAAHVADKCYPQNLSSIKINRLAIRLAKSFNIKERPVCIDLEKIPYKTLRNNDDHPLSWCAKLAMLISQHISLSEIGYVGVAYNFTYHKNNLPNLACQVASKIGITPNVMPEEFVNYGCGGGFFPIKSAVRYCKRNEKASLVFIFDQCTSSANFCYDTDYKYFKMNLMMSLLFSDGAAAVLLIPERMRTQYKGTLAKVEDIITNFHLDNMIRSENDRFVLEDKLKDEAPKLVTNSVIEPLITRNGISIDDIKEWSIHQGGSKVLRGFSDKDTLGLTDKQLSRSRILFEKYGNFSSPSCFFVLDSFVKEHVQEQNKYENETFGMIVGFGAGFYQGALLYRWTN